MSPSPTLQVKYSLADFGRGLLTVANAMIEWGRECSEIVDLG